MTLLSCRWTWPTDYTFPFTTRISTVRLLGGWPNTNHSYTVGDLATIAANGSILYHPNDLIARIDNVVSNGMAPLVVLDNVPWCYTALNASVSLVVCLQFWTDGNMLVDCFHVQAGKYGNVHGPESESDYSAFLSVMLNTLKEHYGPLAQTWEYRIGTEPDCK
jgi:hypothetical protein